MGYARSSSKVLNKELMLATLKRDEQGGIRSAQLPDDVRHKLSAT